VLVDEELIAAFYDKLIPEDIHHAVGFEQWLRKASVADPKITLPQS
jgi:ATP-dependent helicase HrpA